MKKFNPRTLITLIRQYYAFYYTQKPVCDKTKLNHLIRTEQIFRYLENIKKPQIEIQDINVDFIHGFMDWSGEIYDQTNNARNVDLLKKVIDYAMSKGIVTLNPIKQITFSRSPIKEIVEVSDNELDDIYKYSGSGLNKKASINYSFSSESGLSYGDLWSFKIVNNAGIDWINGFRKKGKYGVRKEYWIPLSDRARTILQQCNGKLPYISNLDYNLSIREVAKELNIKKHLTTHTARKTFATRMFNKGYSKDTIADMMAIDTNTLKYYIKHSNSRILNEHLKITM